MKILVVNWQDIRNPQAGGAEVHLHEVFSRIARLGHEVTLYCSSFPGAPPEEEINGIRVIRRGGRYLFNFLFPLAYLRRFRHENFDVVVDDMNKIPFFTPLYINEPLYGVTHHLFDTSIFEETNLILGSYVYLMERLAVRLYRSRRVPFIVGSPSTDAELMEKKFRRDDVALIHYGVDHHSHWSDPSKKLRTPLVGYVGRLKKYKSVDHFLRAIPMIRTHVSDARFLVVGEGDDKPRLVALAHELHIEDVVEFTGFVSEERKVELLRELWICVAPSSKEGWGLTVVEANACGTPVVASNVQGLRDAVKDGVTGILYPYGNVEALAQACTSLLSDSQRLARLTADALLWAGKFNWDDAAEKTLELLEKKRGEKREKGRE